MDFENMDEKVTCVVDQHPVAVTVIGGLIGLLVSMPVVVLGYRYLGRCAGRSAAKELIEAGIKLGYNHD